MNKASITDWLDVGNHHSCPDDGYGIVVHIFRTDTNDRQERSCIHPEPDMESRLAAAHSLEVK